MHNIRECKEERLGRMQGTDDGITSRAKNTHKKKRTRKEKALGFL